MLFAWWTLCDTLARISSGMGTLLMHQDSGFRRTTIDAALLMLFTNFVPHLVHSHCLKTQFPLRMKISLLTRLFRIKNVFESKLGKTHFLTICRLPNFGHLLGRSPDEARWVQSNGHPIGRDLFSAIVRSTDCCSEIDFRFFVVIEWIKKQQLNNDRTFLFLFLNLLHRLSVEGS